MTDGQVLGERHGVVLPVRVDRSGVTGPTPRAAAGPEWRRTSRGHYVPSYVEPTTAQRIAEVGAVLPERVAVTGGRRCRGHAVPAPAAGDGAARGAPG